MDWNEKIRLATAGDMDAQYELGSAYFEGEKGLDRNISEAKKWFLMAANQKCSAAQFNLALIYKAEKDGINAKFWLDKADENGHAIPEAIRNKIEQL